MINPKTVQRKKSQNLISIKDNQKDQQPQMKKKKSVSNIICLSKLKKQAIGDKQQKPIKKQKQQKQKKLIHSLSKGKINKKHHKSQRNDQNFNSMNHKRSIEKFNTVGKNSKQLVKTKKGSDQIVHDVKNEKIKNNRGQCLLTKVPSEVKINGIKKVEKKKLETQQPVDERNFFRNQERQKTHEEKLKHTSSHTQKTLSRNPTSKKLTIGQKSKLKKPLSQSQSQARKSTRQKMKPNTKIAQIIQRSILYSDVNYDFKEQISLLGSGIKRQQDFFVPYPFQFEKMKSTSSNKYLSQRSLEQNKAAITIQRHFRGYIQRKYIQQARYIIDSIKKIQRFWRDCLNKRKQAANKIKMQQKRQTQMRKQLIENSLITVKDLNEDTYRGKDMLFENRNLSNNEEIDRNILKDIIKNLLSQQTVNQSIKQRIRSVMADQSQYISDKNLQSKHKSTKNDDQLLVKSTKYNTNKPTLQLIDTQQQQQNNGQLSQQQHQTKQDYVKRKISMQISSQRNFNSPMNNLSKQFLTSPNIKRMTSPKCLTSSLSKDVKSSYNNYFRSVKSGGVFMSPKSSKEQGQRMLRSHSGSKMSKEKEQCNNNDGRCGGGEQIVNNNNVRQQHTKVFNSDYQEGNSNKHTNNPAQSSQINNNINKQQPLQLSKTDYLLQMKPDTTSINSPIIQCKSPSSQSFVDLYQEDVNLLSTQKILRQQQLQQQETRRNYNKNVNDNDNDDYHQQHLMLSPTTMLKHLKPFPTEFCFIEQFCLLITDYLREDQQTTQIFLEKVKGLKYCKIQKVFQSWQHIEFQQYWSENQPLRMMILEEHNRRPAIFSRIEKNLLLEYPALRLFLSQNDYSTQQILIDTHPKSGYVKFMFDVFEQCIYDNYRHIGLKELSIIQSKQSRRGTDSMSVILSQAMGNMLRSAQMLCGSFQTQDMTQVQRQQRQLMNQMRLGEMVKEYREERLDEGSCGMWIQLLIGRMVFQSVVDEVVVEMIQRMEG